MLNINLSLLPAKGHYFAYFGSLAGIIPFGGTIASQFGASPALVGTIYLTLQFSFLFAKPGFGLLADKLQQKKAIFLSSILLATLAFFAICFIPPIDEAKTSVSLQCHNQTISLEVCAQGPTAERPITTCNVTCQQHITMTNQMCKNHPSDCQSDQSHNTSSPLTTSFIAQINFREAAVSSEGCYDHVFKSFQNQSVCVTSAQIPCNISCDDDHVVSASESNAYGINPQITYFWILMITAHIFTGTVTSMGDTIVLSMIPDIGIYGKQRMYGSLGYGLVAIVSGQLVDMFSDANDQKSNFTPAYCIVLLFGLIDLMIASRLKENKVEKPKNLLRHVARLFQDAETMLLTIAVFLIGFFSGVLWTFLNVYLVSLNASLLLIGLTYGPVQCFLGEMPFMFVSNWFLKKIGHAHAMTLVLAVFGIRFLLYSFIDNPWLVLPIDTTQGICFGVFLTALATYTTVIAPPSLQATVQGILQGVFEGLGAGTGAFFGGLVYQALGGKMMWLVMGGSSCGFAIIYALMLGVIQARKTKKSPGAQNDVTIGDAGLNEVEITELTQVQPVNEQHDIHHKKQTID